MAFWRRLKLLLLAGLVVSCGGDDSTRASAQVTDIRLAQGPEGEPRIEASLAHQFGAPILEALHHGVSLTLEWRVELLQERDNWLDQRVWSQRGARRIHFRPLSQRYTVVDEVTGQTSSYAELDRVMEALSVLTVDLDQPWPQSDPPYARFRTRLVTAELPPPLRLPSYLSADWRLDSGWHRGDPAAAVDNGP
ncbi:MAG: DUF4390 domain-containing protein [Xanthomonadales bacterium]|nr:DUF4390 domain-containing protein [Xanthomonadales bacterium]